MPNANVPLDARAYWQFKNGRAGGGKWCRTPLVKAIWPASPNKYKSDAKIEGNQVQQMLLGGQEVIFGAVRRQIQTGAVRA
jgi:hypothetical protein